MATYGSARDGYPTVPTSTVIKCSYGRDTDDISAVSTTFGGSLPPDRGAGGEGL